MVKFWLNGNEIEWPRQTILYADVARLSGHSRPTVKVFYTSHKKSVDLRPMAMTMAEPNMLVTAEVC